MPKAGHADLTCLNLGAGNEYIKGTLVHIADHMGLGTGSTQSALGRKKDEQTALALAALRCSMG